MLGLDIQSFHTHDHKCHSSEPKILLATAYSRRKDLECAAGFLITQLCMWQVDVSKDGRALQKLRREAERAKRALSSQHQVRVEVESLAEGVDLSEPLTRARFEELNADLFKKTLGPVKRVRLLARFVVMITCRPAL